MPTVTKPIALDETLQRIAAAMEIHPNAIDSKTTAQATSLQANHTTVISDSPATMNLAFTLADVSSTVDTEWRLIFVAGTTTTMAVTAPTGYVLNWADGEPTWTAGTLYEISFASLEKPITSGGAKVIGVLFKEYTA